MGKEDRQTGTAPLLPRASQLSLSTSVLALRCKQSSELFQRPSGPWAMSVTYLTQLHQFHLSKSKANSLIQLHAFPQMLVTCRAEAALAGQILCSSTADHLPTRSPLSPAPKPLTVANAKRAHYTDVSLVAQLAVLRGQYWLEDTAGFDRCVSQLSSFKTYLFGGQLPETSSG